MEAIWLEKGGNSWFRDIGLIMARRMTLEGADVLAVAELMPYSGVLIEHSTMPRRL